MMHTRIFQASGWIPIMKSDMVYAFLIFKNGKERTTYIGDAQTSEHWKTLPAIYDSGNIPADWLIFIFAAILKINSTLKHVKDIGLSAP